VGGEVGVGGVGLMGGFGRGWKGVVYVGGVEIVWGGGVVWVGANFGGGMCCGVVAEFLFYCVMCLGVW